MNLLRFDKPDFSKVLVPNSSFGNKEQGNGEKKLLKAGESFTVSRGVYHKFFNETDKEVIASAEVSEGFAFMLTQLYGVANDNPEIFASPKLLLQLSAWGSDFDSYLKDNYLIYCILADSLCIFCLIF